ncbi:hypothetical protein HELRODRAFT_169329 [Helobdella robusta]|uniref:Uncharacterized protein n=1 Tax=Helobdella robusta TaxID=6412 RepID=T1F1S6_HELRO|nr:hypothetical protein HELRODRAFT_169329 [Helobdella robusta]ESO08477.1 hypothetical protein HELRODRAFT_169329 [Helobdella robusta]
MLQEQGKGRVSICSTWNRTNRLLKILVQKNTIHINVNSLQLFEETTNTWHKKAIEGIKREEASHLRCFYDAACTRNCRETMCPRLYRSPHRHASLPSRHSLANFQ